MFRLILLIETLFLLTACNAPTSWVTSSIATGNTAFDSTRLQFISSEAHPPLTFEMIQFADHTEAYIYLNRFRFSSNPIPIQVTIEEEVYLEEVFIHEGAMRLKLSSELTKRIILALQDGKEVGILIDGFEEKLTPKERGFL